jgi:polysaccharide biosynthesis transport protein
VGMNTNLLHVVEQVSPIAAEQSSSLDLLKIWRIARRRWRVLCGGVLVVMAASAVWLLQITPIYTATAQLLIDTRKVNTTAEAVVSELILDSDTIATEISLIKSFSVARRVAESRPSQWWIG